jgi:hypothetical protein
MPPHRGTSFAVLTVVLFVLVTLVGPLCFLLIPSIGFPYYIVVSTVVVVLLCAIYFWKHLIPYLEQRFFPELKAGNRWNDGLVASMLIGVFILASSLAGFIISSILEDFAKNQSGGALDWGRFGRILGVFSLFVSWQLTTFVLSLYLVHTLLPKQLLSLALAADQGLVAQLKALDLGPAEFPTAFHRLADKLKDVRQELDSIESDVKTKLLSLPTFQPAFQDISYLREWKPIDNASTVFIAGHFRFVAGESDARRNLLDPMADLLSQANATPTVVIISSHSHFLSALFTAELLRQETNQRRAGSGESLTFRLVSTPFPIYSGMVATAKGFILFPVSFGGAHIDPRDFYYFNFFGDARSYKNVAPELVRHLEVYTNVAGGFPRIDGFDVLYELVMNERSPFRDRLRTGLTKPDSLSPRLFVDSFFDALPNPDGAHVSCDQLIRVELGGNDVALGIVGSMEILRAKVKPTLGAEETALLTKLGV